MIRFIVFMVVIFVARLLIPEYLFKVTDETDDGSFSTQELIWDGVFLIGGGIGGAALLWWWLIYPNQDFIRAIW